MVGFQKKNITTAPRLGEQLVARRTELELTLKQAAHGCKIQPRYLTALEEGAYHQLPGEVYAKSFLKAYAEFLGLNVSALLERYGSERAIQKNAKTTAGADHDRPVAKISRTHMLQLHKLFRLAGVLVVAFLFLGYLGVKVQAIVSPPGLMLTSPQSDIATQDSFIEVAGQAEPGASITVNGQTVVAEQDGTFIELVDLKSGLNTIEVRAQKKHSQPAVISRNIVVVGID
jgi:cytoskeletal protein RodZ